MNAVRTLISALALSALVSACAENVTGNRSPSDPSKAEPYLFSSAKPAPSPAIVAPLALLQNDDGGWSNLWTAQTDLGRGATVR